MNIGIIGTGNIGTALAIKWKNAGHRIIFGVRDIHTFKGKNSAEEHNIEVKTIRSTIIDSDILVLAIPPLAIFTIIELLTDIDDKIIIDTSNSIFVKPVPYPTIYHALADKSNAQIVKCFNSTGFENLINPTFGELNIDMFMAGDHPKAKDIARSLAIDCGFSKCIDFGGSDKVELLESLAFTWINLAIHQKMGRNIGFKVLIR